MWRELFIFIILLRSLSIGSFSTAVLASLFHPTAYIYRTSEPPATQNTVAGENLTKRLRGPCLFSKLIEDDSAYRVLMTCVCNACD